MQHWAFELADKIIAKNPNKDTFVCAAGVSPSGSAHVGNLRDLITPLFVGRALTLKGKKVKNILSWDDFDRLRKIPDNVAEVTTGFEANIGKPYSMVEDPFGTCDSYAVQFETAFEASIEKLALNDDIKFIRQYEMYTSGQYVEQIKWALKNRHKIYDILIDFKTQDSDEGERENYFPITVYCDKSLKDSTKVTAYNEETGELEFYCRECGETHKVNVNDYHLIKLVWRVDWPVRWKFEGVDFEAGGIDHATIGGSYDVGKVLAKKLLDHEAPVFQGYGWLGIRGLGSMHSSKGNVLTPEKMLNIYEAEIIRWLFAKYQPTDAFEFAFDDMVIRNYTEYDRFVEGYLNGTLNEYETQMAELIFFHQKPQKKTDFAVIASVAPIVNFNAETLKNALAKTGIEFNENSVNRIEMVKNWIRVYNPEKEHKLLTKFNAEYYSSLDDEAKTIVQKLAEFLRDNAPTDKEIQQFLYSIINDANLSKKENIERQKVNFKNLYNLLFGKNEGPRLYLFLATAEKKDYLFLLSQNI